MIITVGLDEENDKGVVWLFPVPSDPNKVVIDIVKNLPQLSGEDISKKAKSNLDGITQSLQLTQIYPIVLVPNVGRFLGSEGVTGGREQDVVVYEHLEKGGITSEIITAKTAEGLSDYFKSKGQRLTVGLFRFWTNILARNFRSLPRG